MYGDQKFEIFPLNVGDAIAFFVFFIAPDKKLFLPLFTAKLIASAMLIGSCDLATEEFNNTPSRTQRIFNYKSYFRKFANAPKQVRSIFSLVKEILKKLMNS